MEWDNCKHELGTNCLAQLLFLSLHLLYLCQEEMISLVLRITLFFVSVISFPPLFFLWWDFCYPDWTLFKLTSVLLWWDFHLPDLLQDQRTKDILNTLPPVSFEALCTNHLKQGCSFSLKLIKMTFDPPPLIFQISLLLEPSSGMLDLKGSCATLS